MADKNNGQNKADQQAAAAKKAARQARDRDFERQVKKLGRAIRKRGR